MTDHVAEAQRMLRNRPGWWPLLAQLLADVAAIDPAAQLDAGTKFGAIRVRGGGDDPRIGKLIRACEDTSVRTCETCGDTVTARPRWCFSWVTTLCNACALTHPGGRRPADGPGGSAYPPHAELTASCPDCGYSADSG